MSVWDFRHTAVGDHKHLKSQILDDATAEQADLGGGVTVAGAVGGEVVDATSLTLLGTVSGTDGGAATQDQVLQLGPSSPITGGSARAKIIVNDDTGVGAFIEAYSSGPVGGVLNLAGSRGTPDAPLASQDGDEAGEIQFIGSFGGNISDVAGVIFVTIDGIPTDSVVPGRMTLAVKNLDGSLTAKIILRADGNIVMPNLPASDPAVAGALWNDAGTVKVSAG